MTSDSISTYKLEKHETKDVKDNHVNGSLTVLWRDWDSIIKNPPKMIYVSSINPGEIKGPHLHTKRSSYFTCVQGKVIFIIKNLHGEYIEIQSADDDPIMIYVPKGYPSAHVNLSKEISRVITLADISWRPNDNEMKNVVFEDYDWKKWQSS